jgi:hypothetical protein
MLVADLTDEQRADIIQVLDGMVRERSAGSGPGRADGALRATMNLWLFVAAPRRWGFIGLRG